MNPGQEFRYGCSQQFAWWLEPWTATLAGICSGLIIIHLIQIIMASRLKTKIRKYKNYHLQNYNEAYDVDMGYI